MKLFLIFSILFLQANAGLRFLLTNGKFSPASISNLVLWLDGNDSNTINSGSPVNNDPVSTWKDKSPSSRNATQSTPAQQPTFKTSVINGKNALSFAGGTPGNYLALSSYFMVHNQAFDFFFLINPSSVTGEHFYYNDLTNSGTPPAFSLVSSALKFYNGNAWATGSYTTTQSINTTYLIEFNYNGSGDTTTTNFATNKNGSSISRTSVANGNGSPSTTAIGGDILDPGFAGYIGEVIFYSKLLSSAERTLLQNYLQAKWNY